MKRERLSLSKKEKKEYLDNRGVYCPVCGSEECDSYDHEFDSEFVYAYCECSKCGAYWTDTFQLVDVELDLEQE